MQLLINAKLANKKSSIQQNQHPLKDRATHLVKTMQLVKSEDSQLRTPCASAQTLFLALRTYHFSQWMMLLTLTKISSVDLLVYLPHLWKNQTFLLSLLKEKVSSVFIYQKIKKKKETLLLGAGTQISLQKKVSLMKIYLG